MLSLCYINFVIAPGRPGQRPAVGGVWKAGRGRGPAGGGVGIFGRGGGPAGGGVRIFGRGGGPAGGGVGQLGRGELLRRGKPRALADADLLV